MKKALRKILRPPYAYLRYLTLRYLKNRQFKPFELYDKSLDVSAVCGRHRVSYFGYYNVSPENDKGQLLYIVPEKKGRVGLYVSDPVAGEKKIGETSAFNWQQGCMPQWGYANRNLVYYNLFDEVSDSYQCAVYDVLLGKETARLPMPVYSLSKQEDYALSLNFERLALMRPDYGYFCRHNVVLPDNRDDGIWKIDIADKEAKLIITLQQLIDLKPVATMEMAMHKVNHIDISPDGRRFMFLHRWIGPQGRFMRLITANADGSDIYILNGDKMTSHCFWTDSKSIVSFCNTPEFGDAYTLFTDQTGDYEKISDSLPPTDGHPSISPNGQWMITDTYPGNDGMSRLYLYNMRTDEVSCLGRFWQPLKYDGPKRIDLHPKWNRSGDRIYFESGHDGHRKLYVMNLPQCLK